MAHIMVVEDEPNVRRLWRNILSFEDHEVSEFENGMEAVAYYKDNHASVDLCLLDILMPEMDGEECFRQLKASNPDIKAIAITAYAFEETVENLRNAGIHDVLTKPISGKVLAAAVNDLLKA